MAARKSWNVASKASVSPITRFIKGSRITWFYGLWLHHRGMNWAIWLDCPKEKIVRLLLIFKRGTRISAGEPGPLAPVIPIKVRATGKFVARERHHHP